MNNTIDAIRGLLNLPQLRKFYAEAKLDDGRLVVTEADSMAIGVEVRVMGEEGTAEELADGTYTLEDGTTLVIAENRIAQLGEEQPAAEPEAEQPAAEELAAADDIEKGLQELGVEDEMLGKIMALIKAAYDEKEEAELAAAPAEDMQAAMDEKLSAFAAEVTAAFENVLTRLSAIEDAPAEEGVAYSPATNTGAAPVNLSAMKTNQRAHALIQQFQA